MTPDPRPPKLRPVPITIDDEHDRLGRALGNLMQEDRWVRDFITRLNHTIDEIVRKH